MIFIAILLLLGWVIDQYSGGSGQGGLILAIFLSFGMSMLSYFAGDRIALATSGAQPLTKEQNPYVYRLVENLCITAGLPLPKIYIIPDSAMNAFATGRDPNHASIAITQGLIDGLENEELEGVIAHELSHIKNYDIRFMTMVVVLVGAISILARIFTHGLMGRSSGNRRNGNVLLIVGIVLAILSPLIAELIKLAVSRKREFLADASGALLTRYPEGLAKALEKIAHSPTPPMANANRATAHLFFANPFGEIAVGKKISGLFSTHPPIDQRIQALRAMEKQPWRMLEGVFNFIFPPYCLGCLQDGPNYCCDLCLQKIELFRDSCPICGQPSAPATVCGWCLKNTVLDRLYITAPYDQPILPDLLSAFKFENIQSLSKSLGQIMLSTLPHFPAGSISVPMPLSWWRWQERGFNQSEVLGEVVMGDARAGSPVSAQSHPRWDEHSRGAAAAGPITTINPHHQTHNSSHPPLTLRGGDLEVNPRLLSRRWAFKQSHLSANERARNIRGKFYCPQPELIHNQKIVLLDDLYTTGATLNEAAKTLKSAGASQVIGWALAKG